VFKVSSQIIHFVRRRSILLHFNEAFLLSEVTGIR